MTLLCIQPVAGSDPWTHPRISLHMQNAEILSSTESSRVNRDTLQCIIPTSEVMHGKLRIWLIVKETMPHCNTVCHAA